MRTTASPADLARQTIDLMDRAAEANRSDPFRQALLIELPTEGEILVAGDLHGNRKNLDRILQLANLPRYRDRHLILHELVHDFHENNGSCRSHRLVDMGARLKLAFPRQVHFILGNHEFAELLNLPIGKQGRELNASFAKGGVELYGDAWPEVKRAYDRFWMSHPVAVRTANGLFVSHSTPRLEKLEGLSLEYLRTTSAEVAFQRKSPIFDMLWGRDYRVETANAVAGMMDATVLIVGHTPCEEGMATPNDHHVILDCKDRKGCYALLPLDRPVTHDEAARMCRRLYS